MDKNHEITTNDLATMVQAGFKDMGERIDKRFTGVDEKLDHVDARLGRIEADLSELRGEIVYRHEFEDVLGRVKQKMAYQIEW